MIFLLAISISTLNLPVMAQGQNQPSPGQSQEVQNKLGALTHKFRELVTKSGVNITCRRAVMLWIICVISRNPADLKPFRNSFHNSPIWA